MLRFESSRCRGTETVELWVPGYCDVRVLGVSILRYESSGCQGADARSGCLGTETVEFLVPWY